MAIAESKDLTLPQATAPSEITPTNPPINLDQSILTLRRNIKVRTMQHSDATAFAKYGNNKKIAQNMRAAWPDPYTVDKGHDFIARIRNQETWTSTDIGNPNLTKSNEQTAQKLPQAWTITMDDEPIGSMGCEFNKDTQERTVAFGYWIAEEYWGQGIATDLVAAFVPWFWRTYPYIVRMEAMVYAWNPASTKVLERNGFQREGTLRASVWRYGRLTDLFIYGLVKDGVEVTLKQPSLEK